MYPLTDFSICLTTFKLLEVEKPSHQELVLSFDSWVILSCKRLVASDKNSLDNPFTLAPALEEGYFSDLEICAAGGQKVTK